MKDTKGQFCRITLEKPTFTGPVFNTIICSGYMVDFEPGEPPKLEFIRRIEPGEPDRKTEIAYSTDALEPLTIVFKDRKEHLTQTLFIFFRFIYDSFRAKGQDEFSFSEIYTAFRGRQVKMTKDSIESNVKRLQERIERLKGNIEITYMREIVYVRKFCGKKSGNTSRQKSSTNDI